MKKLIFNIKGVKITVNSWRGNDRTMCAKVNTFLEYNGEKIRYSFNVENGYNWYCNCLNEKKVIECVEEWLKDF